MREISEDLLRGILGSNRFQISALAAGASSVNLRVVAGAATFVLRLDYFRSLADVEMDDVILTSARASGVRTPPAIVTCGRWRDVTFSLRGFVAGQALTLASGVPLRLLQTAGRQLAAIHSADTRPARAWFYREAPRGALLPDAIGNQLVHAAVAEMTGVMDRSPGLICEETLVHTDYKPDNLVYVGDRTLVVLDWEKATTGSRLFDLGLAVFHVIAGSEWSAPGRRLREFLSGYGEIPRESELDSSLLRDAVLYAASVFYLVDAEIASGTLSAPSAMQIDTRHLEYFRSYCTPAFGRLVRLAERPDVWRLGAASG